MPSEMERFLWAAVEAQSRLRAALHQEGDPHETRSSSRSCHSSDVGYGLCAGQLVQHTSRDTDPGNYLNGPKTQDFYTDESRTNVRPPAEFKQVWDKMNETDRADVKQACSANRDVSYNPFCTNVGGM